MANLKADVVIIGVGAAGGIIGAELAKAGTKVVGLERGPRLQTADFSSHDELRYFQRGDTRPNPKTQPITWRPDANTKSRRLDSINYGNQVGGGTVHYGAISWRFHEGDFRVRSQTIERYGASLLEGTSVTDWPLSYADLEPYYDRAEYDLGISGRAGNLAGKKIDGGNVFEGPRSREYPLGPLHMTQADSLFDKTARNMGYHPFPTPRAILSEPYKGRPGCSYCGSCQAFGCHIGAKSSILVTKIPEADATGNFKIMTGTMVYRINSDPSSGKVTSVSYYGPDGSENTIEADLIILTSYIYDNTRLLLLSKNGKYPNGLANSSGMVGKGMTSHPGARAFGVFDDRYTNVYMGPSNQKHSIDDFNADNFDHSGLGFIRGAQVSVSCAALDAGPIGVATNMTPPEGTPTWGPGYRDFLAKYFARYVAITAQTENLPYLDQMIDLDPDVRDAWGLPAPRITYDWRKPGEVKRVLYMQDKVADIARAMGASKVWTGRGVGNGAPGGHHSGGTRMGSDPTQSVVNKYGQTWDAPNLFVVGSSTYPTIGAGFNTTLTLQALAYMTADALVNKYIKSPGQML